MARSKIQVLIVDDSPVDRELLIEIIKAEPDFEVVGQAADAYEARDKIRILRPDVVTLDVSMPGMDGIKFLRNLMRLRPMPVVMISVATEVGAAVTLDALEIGAVDFVAKPGASGRDFNEYRSEVASKVRMAAYARVVPYRGGAATPAAAPVVAAPGAAPGHEPGSVPTPAAWPDAAPNGEPFAVVTPEAARAVEPAKARAARRSEARRQVMARRRARREGAERSAAAVANATANVRPAANPNATPVAAATEPARGIGASLKRDRAVPVDLIAIGASTGGVSAIETLLEGLPAEGLPAIVITQHIPAGFSESFALRLDSKLEMKVRQASDGLPVQAGHVYIAPGGQQFAIERAGDGYVCRVTRDERVNLHRPSVQVLFQSVAKHAGPRALGVMLTGMGADGAQAMLEMRAAGAYNLVQDEATSVVWGMPGAAAKLGAANEVLPLSAIPQAIAELAGAARGSLRRRLARRGSAGGEQPL